MVEALINPESVKRSASAAGEIVRFWFVESGRRKWYLGGPSFDAEIRARFAGHHAAAAAGLLDAWRATPAGALALLIILDQFSRNMFRRDARAFATDPYARMIADGAMARRFDKIAPMDAQAFFYLPFMHSEILADQHRSVALFTALLAGSSNLRYATLHAEIVERFGRFPHRNAVLRRPSTQAEIDYLAQGGFSA